MKDAESVITEATEGIIDKLMADYEVKKTRVYEMLGDQCVYPKAKVLIRRIAAHNQAGARLIKADLEAMFADILDPIHEEVSDAELHGELNDAVQARLRHAPKQICMKEDREALEVLNRDLTRLESPAVPIRTVMKEVVARRNGNR
jgi:hypothetical protein